MKLFFFPEKNKYVSRPYLKFLDLLPETHLFFYLGNFFSEIRQGYRDTEQTAQSSGITGIWGSVNQGQTQTTRHKCCWKVRE